MITIQARNSFEKAGRFRKVLALVAAIDGACKEPRSVLDPIRHGNEVADMLASWPDDCWRRAALLAGVVPKSGKLPSEVTRAAVVDFYRERARRAA